MAVGPPPIYCLLREALHVALFPLQLYHRETLYQVSGDLAQTGFPNVCGDKFTVGKEVFMQREMTWPGIDDCWV